MPSVASNPASAVASVEGDDLMIRLGGNWRITGPHPDWIETIAGQAPRPMCLDGSALGDWDSSLALFLREARNWAEQQGVPCRVEAVPAGAEKLAGLLAPQTTRKPRLVLLPNPVNLVGATTIQLWVEIKELANLVGECAYSVVRFFRGQAQFRWRDCLDEMQQCGAMALPIVGLISFLVGVTLAYTGSIVVRQYGGDIWVADMVGLAVVREMGPMMAAIVLAGRTGAAYAATLGNMKANEEIDALATLGVSPIDFLVMPRMVALFLMMPFLGLYADGMGILGGMVIAAVPPLHIPFNLFWAEMQTIVDLSDINTGIIKAATYGLLIGLAGCLRGLQAERSAVGVGVAATQAVVTGILLIIMADALYAVVFDILGW